MPHSIFFNAQLWLRCFDQMHESVAFSHSRRLYAINMDVRPGGCRIILKAFTNNRPEIAFINASTPERCCELLDAWFSTKAKMGIDWKPDKYYRPDSE